MTSKIATIGFCLLMCSFNVQSQEFGIDLNGGIQGLRFDITGGSQGKPQAGGSAGVHYIFPLSARFGLLTGIGCGYYNAKATLQDGATFSSWQVDNAGSAFQYNISTTGYTETQHFFGAGIPVMLQYHTIGNNTQWYLSAGTKFIFPFNAKIKATAQQLKLSGYYPDFNVEVFNVPQHGFASLSNWQSSRNIELKPTATLSGSTSISFKMGERMRLYTGVYIDLGLTDMKKTDSYNSLIMYNPGGTANPLAGGVFSSSNTGQAKLFACGLQIKLGLERRKRKPVQQPSLEPVMETAQQVTAQPAIPSQEQPKQFVPEETVQAPPPQRPINPVMSVADSSVFKQPVTFSVLGQTTIPESAYPHLDSVIAILNKYAGTHIEIVGHTCNIGSESENIKVGEERARTVASYLQSKGIPFERMHIRSSGLSDPLVPNSSTLNRQVNRRVTIILK
ncbi:MULTISPECIES: OmpA family protein [Niastella]|uniref:OmpA family protein n=1 Tax=Niastella soli TaxID=2821487 RepID=A0ABS3YTU6_9BACT|nr:OmpA family protein [Niastella soli]MBO9201300.1 OmpA family protein [Niastella soli]